MQQRAGVTVCQVFAANLSALAQVRQDGLVVAAAQLAPYLLVLVSPAASPPSTSSEPFLATREARLDFGPSPLGHPVGAPFLDWLPRRYDESPVASTAKPVVSARCASGTREAGAVKVEWEAYQVSVGRLTAGRLDG